MLLIEFAECTRFKMVGFGDAEEHRQPCGLEVTEPCGLDATMAPIGLGTGHGVS